MSRRMRMPVALTMAVAAATPLVPMFAGTASAATPPVPRLPSGIEDLAPYVGQQFCGPDARPGVVAFRNMVLRTYPYTASYGIVRDCSLGGRSEHKEGRAWDWKLSASSAKQKAAAESLVSWLLAPDAQGRPAAMARRIGIMYIIWNGQIWKSYDLGWHPYVGISEHRDHVHFSFSWEGALRQTSFFSGQVAAPLSGPPFSLPRQYAADTVATSSASSGPAFPGNIGYGATGTTVRSIQSAVGSRVSGWYGPVTVTAVKAYQATKGIPTTGIVGTQTWAALFGARPPTIVPALATSSSASSGPAFPGNVGYGATGTTVRSVQSAVGSRVSGWYGPVTVTAVKAYQASKGIPTSGIVGERTWAALFGGSGGGSSSGSGASSATASSSFPGNIGYGATGTVVRSIQAKAGAPVSGWFGPMTQSAVKAYQAARGIPTTGIVGPQTWGAMFGGGSSTLVAVAAYAPTGTSFPGNVGYDSRGDVVRRIQAKVGATVSGWYGPVTVSAVKAYQAKKGIPTTGIVGPQTWRSLFG